MSTLVACANVPLPDPVPASDSLTNSVAQADRTATATPTEQPSGILLQPTAPIATPDIAVTATPETPELVLVDDASTDASDADSTDVAIDRSANRPIATVDMTHSADASDATETPTPTPTPTNEMELAVNQSDEVTRAEFKLTLQGVRDEMRNLVFTLDSARSTGSIDCQELIKSYDFIAEAPGFATPRELSIPYEYYEQGVSLLTTQVADLATYCRDFVETTGETMLATADIEPQEIWYVGLREAQKSLLNIYDSVLWLNADPGKIGSFYEQMRVRIVQYGARVNNAIGQNCDVIRDAFDAVVYAPRLSPPSDYRFAAYQHYLKSIEALAEGGRDMNLYCNAYDADVAAGRTDPSLIDFVPDTTVATASSGYETALQEINFALSLRPTPAPTPTPIFVPAHVVRTQPGQRDYLYEIVIKINMSEGTPPYSALIGGFVMEPDNTITIVHTCRRDFIDRVILVDARGTQYISPQLEARRPHGCNVNAAP